MTNNRPKNWLRAIIVSAILSAGVVAAIFFRVPYCTYRAYYCPYCRAVRGESAVLFIKLPTKVKGNSVTRYWLTNIDEQHKHRWIFGNAGYDCIGGGGVSDGTEAINSHRRMLKENAELAILRSFKSPAERKAFVANFLAFDRTHSEDGCYTVVQLNEAYRQNPSRKDWQKILKRLKVME